MMKKILALAAMILCLIGLKYVLTEKEDVPKSISPNGANSNPQERIDWMHNRLKDPATGEIPVGIRKRELQFAKTIKPAEFAKNATWTARGPFNIGGRTRALAIDVTNDSILVAGSVSGGLWRSSDQGQNWDRVSQPDQFPSITSVAQDTRVGKTDTWYCGTGELIGASASGTGAYFYGDGMMKSVDGGLSWTTLAATSSNMPQSFDSHWNFVHRVVTDPSVDTADVVYAATFGRINRSDDGGQTWQTVLGGDPEAYYVELDISTTGVLYATLSADGTNKGIWRSPDGINWTNILDTDTFPPVYERIVMAFNPSNENEIYFLGRTPGYGQHSDCFFGREDWNSLWKYTYLSGNGADTGGVWTNLSMNIPNNGITDFDNFNSQGGYNLTIRVSPSDPDLILIGATNLYRSTDGFTSMNNTTQIGGYYIGSWSPGHWGSYLNHHPDQHEIRFLPSNPNKVLSASDGGIALTDNIYDSIVAWNSLNQGYLTTQLYTVGVDPSGTDDMMMAGFQDNGNYYINSTNPQDDWVMPLNGDGSYMGIADGAEYFYLSIQQGRVYKMKLDSAGGVLGFGRIDPIGQTKSDYLFINPLVLDPNNNDIMYLPAGNNLWRNDQLSSIPLAGNYDTISQGWFNFSDSISTSLDISCIAVSKNPANVVWYGTSSRRIYKIVDAHVGDPTHIQMPIIGFPPANVSSIAINPHNADEVVVVFSNYSVYSLYYTLDGGDTWVKGAGNLEEFANGSGAGPSIRSVTILPVGQDYLYVVGTSIGMFATAELDSLNTEWHQLGADVFGNVVVEMVYSRETDGLLIAATHGKGIYSTKITDIGQVVPLEKEEIVPEETNMLVYPNPIEDVAHVEFNLKQASKVTISLLTVEGKLIKTLQNGQALAGSNKQTVSMGDILAGTYLMRIETQSDRFTKQVMKK